MRRSSGTGLLTVSIRGHHYAINYNRDEPAEALRQIGRWACNNQLNLSWFDAARLSARVRLKASQDRVKV